VHRRKYPAESYLNAMSVVRVADAPDRRRCTPTFDFFPERGICPNLPGMASLHQPPAESMD
jgi:hypothetical protein